LKISGVLPVYGKNIILTYFIFETEAEKWIEKGNLEEKIPFKITLDRPTKDK
jgi:hypothetical protein